MPLAQLVPPPRRAPSRSESIPSHCLRLPGGRLIALDRELGLEGTAGGRADLLAMLRAVSPERPDWLRFTLIPFSPSDSVQVSLGRPRPWRVVPPVRSPRPARADLRSEPQDRERYQSAVRAALSCIAAGSIEKVVVARELQLDGHNWNPEALFGHLFHASEDAFPFSCAIPGTQAHLVGVSPELLVQKSGSLVQSAPLAGSRPRGHSAAADAEIGRELLYSEKDQREHAYVADAIRSALGPFCSQVEVEPGEVVQTSTMMHLRSRITGRLKSTRTSALELALALHPTPAVCGTPTATARAVIAELEPFERGYYAGAVGYEDAHGDGTFVVAIRCAEVSPASVRLFAGAGIVSGSIPELEWAETEAKLKTMLQLLEEAQA